jgi:hypothetical protein
MKSHETTEIASIELLHDHRGEDCDLLDSDQLALMHMFFSILDEWDKEGNRSAN